MKITLARALKVKKRIIEKITKISNDITTYNRVAVGNPRDVDINQLILDRTFFKNTLITLKVKIFEAGNSIREEIFRLSELKDDIIFYKGISTERGKVYRRSILDDERDVEYEVILTKANIDNLIKELQKQIDTIQFDVIDKHNNTTMVDIDFNIDDI